MENSNSSFVCVCAYAIQNLIFLNKKILVVIVEKKIKIK